MPFKRGRRDKTPPINKHTFRVFIGAGVPRYLGEGIVVQCVGGGGSGGGGGPAADDDNEGDEDYPVVMRVSAPPLSLISPAVSNRDCTFFLVQLFIEPTSSFEPADRPSKGGLACYYLQAFSP